MREIVKAKMKEKILIASEFYVHLKMYVMNLKQKTCFNNKYAYFFDLQ